MKVPFPINGLVRGLPANEQPKDTSFDLMNVRPYDVTAERIRGGKRPGTTKAYTTSIGGTHPVLYMASVVTTYVDPV